MLYIPFSIIYREWGELHEHERSFFCDEENLHREHAKHIQLLEMDSAKLFSNWALSAIPVGFPDHKNVYRQERFLSIRDKWNSESRIQEVREWLFSTGIPFDREIYLIYDFNRVVRTQWKMLVRYWNEFAWSVGYAMTCVDHTQQWACSFHHEDVIIFGSNVSKS